MESFPTNRPHPVSGLPARVVRRARSIVLIALGCTLPLRAADAAPVYYFNDPVISRVAFQAAAPGPLTLESFEGPFATSSTLSFPVGGPEEFVIASADLMAQSSFSRGVSDGSFSLFVTEQQTLTFLFDQPIHAFGIDVNDLNSTSMHFADDLGNSFFDLLVGDGGGPAGGPGAENLQFFGVTNVEGFTMVQLTFAAPGGVLDNIYLDRLEFAAAVIPEPGTAALMGMGLAGIGLGRRRTR